MSLSKKDNHIFLLGQLSDFFFRGMEVYGGGGISANKTFFFAWVDIRSMANDHRTKNISTTPPRRQLRFIIHMSNMITYPVMPSSCRVASLLRKSVNK